MVGANATTGTGAPAVLRTDAPQRKLPKFDSACEPKKSAPDETEAYTKPVAQQKKLEEWQLTPEGQN